MSGAETDPVIVTSLGLRISGVANKAKAASRITIIAVEIVANIHLGYPSCKLFLEAFVMLLHVPLSMSIMDFLLGDNTLR